MELIQGVRTKLALVSYSHGAIRVPLQQSLNYTPKLTERNINEFDNLEVAQVVTTFDGVDVTFDYLDSDSKLVDAMFADADPTGSVIIDDPSNYKRVHGFANLKGLDSGLIVASILIKEARAKGSPYTEPVKEEAKVTRDLSATNVMKIKGKALYYQRMLASTPAGTVYEQVVPPNIAEDLNFAICGGWGPTSGWSGYSGSISGYSGASGTLVSEVYNTKTAVPYDGTHYDLWVLKNGVDVTGDGSYMMDAENFMVLGVPANTDIWEAFYLFTDTV